MKGRTIELVVLLRRAAPGLARSVSETGPLTKPPMVVSSSSVS